MANHYNRKECVKSFCVGDKVSASIPRIDHACSVYNGITVFITYIFRSEHVMLSTCFPASLLDDYSGPVNGWKETSL